MCCRCSAKKVGNRNADGRAQQKSCLNHSNNESGRQTGTKSGPTAGISESGLTTGIVASGPAVGDFPFVASDFCTEREPVGFSDKGPTTDCTVSGPRPGGVSSSARHSQAEKGHSATWQSLRLCPDCCCKVIAG